MPLKLLVGFDGSRAASAAIEATGHLFPGACGWVTYLWEPPFASEPLLKRVRSIARTVDELVELIEQEGEHEAQALVKTGVAIAHTASWDADPLVKRTFGGEGLVLGQLAEKMGADLLVVGTRGLSGTAAVLGSVSDAVVHYSHAPVLVIPHPLLTDEIGALGSGPVVVGYDESDGARRAFAAAQRVFPARRMIPVLAEDEPSGVPVGPIAGTQVRQLAVTHRGLGQRLVADALVDYAHDLGAAVVVVGSRGRSALREILLGSVAMGVLHRSRRPVMVVHD